MYQKYRLLPKGENGLHQIQALKDFADVKAGDLGGFVQSEDNLSQTGNCWIYDNGQVYQDARVSWWGRVSENAVAHGKARIEGYAHARQDSRIFGQAVLAERACLSGDAWLFGQAMMSGQSEARDQTKIHGNARLSDEAVASEKAELYGDARLVGSAELSGEAKLHGDSKLISGKWKVSPLQIQGTRHHLVTSSPSEVTIGCKSFQIENLLENGESVAKSSGYSEEEALEYIQYVKLAKDWLGRKISLGFVE